MDMPGEMSKYIVLCRIGEIGDENGDINGFVTQNQFSGE